MSGKTMDAARTASKWKNGAMEEERAEEVLKFIVRATNVVFIVVVVVVARTQFSHKHAIDTNNLIYCLCRINPVALALSPTIPANNFICM